MMTYGPGPGPFEKFLIWLSPDRDSALKKHHEIMQKIIRYFVRKGCPGAEDLAGDVRDRVIKIINADGQYPNHGALFYSVADKRWHEYLREPKPEPLPPDPLPISLPDPYIELRAYCLDICLAKLRDSERELITRYYQGSGLHKIEARKLLAVEEGGQNTLRIKTFRIRANLRDCINDCISQQKVN